MCHSCHRHSETKQRVARRYWLSCPTPPAQLARDRSAAEGLDASESAALESSESLLALISAARAGDRRDAQRHSFHAVQRVAPWRGIAKPTETDFQLVWCHDLSTSSISFYWSTAPDFEQVIVRAGIAKRNDSVARTRLVLQSASCGDGAVFDLLPIRPPPAELVPGRSGIAPHIGADWRNRRNRLLRLSAGPHQLFVENSGTSYARLF